MFVHVDKRCTPRLSVFALPGTLHDPLMQLRRSAARAAGPVTSGGLVFSLLVFAPERHPPSRPLKTYYLVPLSSVLLSNPKYRQCKCVFLMMRLIVDRSTLDGAMDFLKRRLDIGCPPLWFEGSLCGNNLRSGDTSTPIDFSLQCDL